MHEVVFDVETSGLSPATGGRVIEIAAVAIGSGGIMTEFSTLIDVDCHIHRAAHEVHGISRTMLRGHPAPREAWQQFIGFVGKAELIAHNARFDAAFLHAELRRLDLTLSNPVRCSLLESRRRFPRLSSHRLESVARHVLGGIPDDCRLHRALGDARLLARVWVAMGRLD